MKSETTILDIFHGKPTQFIKFLLGSIPLKKNECKMASGRQQAWHWGYYSEFQDLRGSEVHNQSSHIVPGQTLSQINKTKNYWGSKSLQVRGLEEKVLSHKYNGLSSIARTQVKVQGENRLHKVVLGPPTWVLWWAHPYIILIINIFNWQVFNKKSIQISYLSKIFFKL